jgi:Tol biopolymer transport system component
MRVLFGIAALAAILAIPAAAAVSANRIVFMREVSDQAELFTVRPDGSGLKRLTRNPGWDTSPTWSPDGRLIASFGGRGGIALSRADGSVVRQIPIRARGSVEELQWSPDGRWLAYLVERCQYADPRGYSVPPCADLWVVRSSGNGTRRLLDRAVDMSDEATSYAWAPDSRRLVYEVLKTGPSLLAVTDLSSGRSRRIPGTADSADPAWAPRDEIVFVRRKKGLFTVRPDGRRLKRLVRGNTLSRPAWSPDGRRLAYLVWQRPVRENNAWGVWVVRPELGRRWRVGTATEDRPLVWSPDSTRLLWEHFLGRLVVAPADRAGGAKVLTGGSDPDWG